MNPTELDRLARRAGIEVPCDAHLSCAAVTETGPQIAQAPSGDPASYAAVVSARAPFSVDAGAPEGASLDAPGPAERLRAAADLILAQQETPTP